MRITTMWRYPVKSMLGERLTEARVDFAGVAFDRGLAVIDVETGLVATAKHPRLWRRLLQYSATVDGDRVLVTSPSGWTRDALAPGVDELLSSGLDRVVTVASERPAEATVERSDPLEVLEHGIEAVVSTPTLRIGQGTPGTSFVDYAPVHVITTATLEAIGAEQIRFRPNLVVETPAGTAPFVENTWVGHELRIGDGLPVLRVALPTPRCAVPTLEHGSLPRAPHAVRTLMTANRIDVPGFGTLPCAGGYAEVVRGGTIHVGDELTVL
ncbi:MAG TPA: MOSC N-terminal beta barrel domain-containing protein [Pseudonocardiaceae bacterium]|jgi:hypothetical protein|nr:MOSC N-terminal beta barrel domain-containing protein [Pseudonocardiaceae bacterium]